jgi:hypothetical protein
MPSMNEVRYEICDVRSTAYLRLRDMVDSRDIDSLLDKGFVEDFLRTSLIASIK